MQAMVDSMKGNSSSRWEDAAPRDGPLTQQERHAPSSKDGDVVILVGKSRRAYRVSAESLRRGSSYFRAWLEQGERGEGGGGDTWRTTVDCEERIFEHLLSVMRYGTLDALPTDLPQSDMVKLRTELHFYGVRYHASSTRCAAPDSPTSTCSSSGSRGPPPSSSSRSSSPASPASPASPPISFSRCLTSAPVPVSRSYHARCPSRLSELPSFPPDLAHPAKLVLVSCSPDSVTDDATCPFCCDRNSRAAALPNKWALNFALRHAFCAGCGRAPLHMPAKLFAEMFMAAASYADPAAAADMSKPSAPTMAMMSSSRKWVVSSDSTCTLRFVEGPRCQRCATSPRMPASGWSAEEEEAGVWAASAYFGHAFCAACGEAAAGPALLSLLLALRYGKVRPNNRRRSSP